jgi:hypothetical protein
MPDMALPYSAPSPPVVTDISDRADMGTEEVKVFSTGDLIGIPSSRKATSPGRPPLTCMAPLLKTMPG